MSTKNREQMMDWLSSHMEFVRTTEEFSGKSGGIWLSAENGDTYRGKEIFNYWTYDCKNYDIGVLKSWQSMCKKYGWFPEWNDCGTIMLWKR